MVQDKRRTDMGQADGQRWGAKEWQEAGESPTERVGAGENPEESRKQSPRLIG